MKTIFELRCQPFIYTTMIGLILVAVGLIGWAIVSQDKRGTFVASEVDGTIIWDDEMGWDISAGEPIQELSFEQGEEFYFVVVDRGSGVVKWVYQSQLTTPPDSNR